MDFMNDFAPYVGLAVILYAIRETGQVSNKYIPIVAILLGVPFAFWEQGIRVLYRWLAVCFVRRGYGSGD